MEHKPFEPALYHTDMADWGQALRICERLVDRRVGSFDLNNRKYTDHDPMVGSITPFELFLGFVEVVSAMHGDEPEVRARRARRCTGSTSRSRSRTTSRPWSVRSSRPRLRTRKAWLVDGDAVAHARAEGDVVGAHSLLQDAFEKDVGPVLAERREECGAPADPVGAYLRSDERARRAAVRVIA